MFVDFGGDLLKKFAGQSVQDPDNVGCGEGVGKSDPARKRAVFVELVKRPEQLLAVTAV